VGLFVTRQTSWLESSQLACPLHDLDSAVVTMTLDEMAIALSCPVNLLIHAYAHLKSAAEWIVTSMLRGACTAAACLLCIILPDLCITRFMVLLLLITQRCSMFQTSLTKDLHGCLLKCLLAYDHSLVI